eukprot:TRINITY_DN30148_c0_g2_i3.p1 TRINITY_DN30148_c0_g2~~TRINITY_DN30148_c0_g2_i3.p1  ORF type:complete len:662 (+),score=95.68 TRINITY_DN30148_c0_g2_i3:33-1988(+)
MKYLTELEPGKPATETRPDISPEYCWHLIPNGPPQLETLTSWTSLAQLFDDSVARFGDKNCLGSRKKTESGGWTDYQWLSYRQVQERYIKVASALKWLKLLKGDRVGIYSPTCPEWTIALEGIWRVGMVCVPLYDSLGENVVEYTLDDAECSGIFVHVSKLDNLKESLPRLKTQIKVIVYWAGEYADTQLNGIPLYPFDKFMELGDQYPADPDFSGLEDLSTVLYTSGTTGVPKGVMLTHRNILSVVILDKRQVDEYGFKLGSNDVFLSYLPLAHSFGIMVEQLMYHVGAQIGCWRGDVKLLIEDVASLRPTFFIGAPRVFDRVYKGVMDKINKGGLIKQLLFSFFYYYKLTMLQMGYSQSNACYLGDLLVFKKIAAALGGRVRILISGSAPLGRHVEDFLKVCMCCSAVQGYGLTETIAASFIAVPEEYSMVGTVGPCMQCNTFRLESVPEMDYYVTNDPPQGEVLIRGQNVFKGYYKMPEKTAEVLDDDGWFRTGDIGEVDPIGSLRIIDRKKNIFKLSQGEYIAVEKLESVFKSNNYVDQIWVYGDSLKNTLVAIVVPSPVSLKALAGTDESLEVICKKEDVIKAVLESLRETSVEKKLKGFERIAALYLESEPFSVENGLLTPTFKFQRNALKKKYQTIIDNLYKDL